MKRKAQWVTLAGVGVALALVCGILLWSFGEARYHPGDVAAAARAGLNLTPAAGIVEGAVGGGSQQWSLEVEPGITVRGLVSGVGSPVVVHGGPGFPPQTTWAGLDAFADRHRFWYPHQRGSGWSDRPVDRFATNDFGANLQVLDAKLGMVPQIADLERLRRALGVEKLDLIGHSFGGLIACLYAVEFPSHVGKILLIAPAAMVQFPTASGGLYEEIRKVLPADRKGPYEAWLRDFFDYGRLFQRTETELRAINAGVIPFYLEAARNGSTLPPADNTNPSLIGGWMMQSLFFSMGQRHDWRPALAGIRCPVTLVYGDADLSEADDFDAYRVIPGLRIAKIPGGIHFVAGDANLFSGVAAVRDVLQ
jgi:proline iminopeptidase